MNDITNAKKINFESDPSLQKYDEYLFDTDLLNEVSSSIGNLIGKLHDLIHECAMKRVDTQLCGIILYWCRDLLIYCCFNDFHDVLPIFNQLMEIFYPLQTLKGIMDCIHRGFCCELVYLCSLCCLEIDFKGFVVFEEEKLEKLVQSFNDKQKLIFQKNCTISNSKNTFMETFANILHQLCRCPSMTSFASHRSLKSFEKISILQGKHLLSISCSHKPLINQMLAELTSYLNDQQSSTELLASTIELYSDSNCAIYSVNTAYLEQLIFALNEFPFRRTKDRNAAIESILKLKVDIEQRLIGNDEELMQRCIKINSSLPADCITARGLVYHAFTTKVKKRPLIGSSLKPVFVRYQSICHSKKRRFSTIESEELSSIGRKDTKHIDKPIPSMNDMNTVECSGTKISPVREIISSEIPSEESHGDGNKPDTTSPITDNNVNHIKNPSNLNTSSTTAGIPKQSPAADAGLSPATAANMDSDFGRHYGTDVLAKCSENQLLVLFNLTKLPVPLLVPLQLLCLVPFDTVHLKQLENTQGVLLQHNSESALVKAVTCIFLINCKNKHDPAYAHILQSFEVTHTAVIHGIMLLKQLMQTYSQATAPTSSSRQSASNVVDLTIGPTILASSTSMSTSAQPSLTQSSSSSSSSRATAEHIPTNSQSQQPQQQVSPPSKAVFDTSIPFGRECQAKISSEESHGDGNKPDMTSPITDNNVNDNKNPSDLNTSSTTAGIPKQQSPAADAGLSPATAVNMDSDFGRHYGTDVLAKCSENQLLVLFNLTKLPVPLLVPLQLLCLVPFDTPFDTVHLKQLENIQGVLLQHNSESALVKAVTCIFLINCKIKHDPAYAYILQSFEVTNTAVVYAIILLKQLMQTYSQATALTSSSRQSASNVVDLTIEPNYPTLASSTSSAPSISTSAQPSLPQSSSCSFSSRATAEHIPTNSQSQPPPQQVSPPLQAIFDTLIPFGFPPGNDLTFAQMMIYFMNHLSPKQKRECQVAALAYLEKRGQKCRIHVRSTQEEVQINEQVLEVVKAILVEKLCSLIASGSYPMPKGGIPFVANAILPQGKDSTSIPHNATSNSSNSADNGSPHAPTGPLRSYQTAPLSSFPQQNVPSASYPMFPSSSTALPSQTFVNGFGFDNNRNMNNSSSSAAASAFPQTTHVSQTNNWNNHNYNWPQPNFPPNSNIPIPPNVPAVGNGNIPTSLFFNPGSVPPVGTTTSFQNPFAPRQPQPSLQPFQHLVQQPFQQQPFQQSIQQPFQQSTQQYTQQPLQQSIQQPLHRPFQDYLPILQLGQNLQQTQSTLQQPHPLTQPQPQPPPYISPQLLLQPPQKPPVKTKPPKANPPSTDMSDVPFKLFQETECGIYGNHFPLSVVLNNNEPSLVPMATTAGSINETHTTTNINNNSGIPLQVAEMTSAGTQVASSAAEVSTETTLETAQPTPLSSSDAIIIHIEDLVTQSRDKVKVKRTKNLGALLKAIRTRRHSLSSSSQPLEVLFHGQVLCEKETLASAGVSDGDVLVLREKQ